MRNIIKKLNQLLRLNFNSYKTVGGGELICEDELEIGSEIYAITSDGQLPASDGQYELEDSTIVKVEDGIIKDISYEENKMEENQVNAINDFAVASLKDGTILESPTFDVGQKVDIVAADRKKTPAPDGEHELMLKDSEGNEVKIRIITEGGIIKERMNVEEMADLSVNDVVDNVDLQDFFKSIGSMLKNMEARMIEMEKKFETMNSQVEKFSKTPAGEPIIQPRNIGSELNQYRNDKFAELRAIRGGAYKK
jgi:hypothetical protein